MKTSRGEEFAGGVPPAAQRVRRTIYRLRPLIPKKAPPTTRLGPSAPYSSPGKGVGGETVNSNAGGSTWRTQPGDKIK